MPEDKRAETLAQIGVLIAVGQTPAELPLHVVIRLAPRA
jgi:hypothetical protein